MDSGTAYLMRRIEELMNEFFDGRKLDLMPKYIKIKKKDIRSKLNLTVKKNKIAR